MAWLNQYDHFVPEEHLASVVGIAAEMGKHDSGFHSHDRGQLLFTQSGCMRITLASRVSVLPPMRIAWIPAKLEHRVEMYASVGYRSVYISDKYHDKFPSESEIFTLSPLLREILERISVADFDTQWEEGRYANLLAVFFDEITQAQRQPNHLFMPKDRRLKRLSFDDLPPALQDMAKYVGASEKTITRLFYKETGLSYQQWRQQWRLMKAIELLATHHRYIDISQILGFASDSAFITFFKKMTGQTPQEYLKS
ncbi:helix-turn-helix transcriptional regulator [Proteus mirabilis]|uniref:Helix-turn-helix domain-containing protein n=1 Tax=Proteus vulgaris TaxID=585 RepID=A0A6G6SFL0_PROVU|nr:helix-turn-helix transcriptional regulator [Proteus vulgaris]MBG3079393.1 helix-turn-helix transcriptional regulator [Proteus mirabilis]QIF93332.1 helix-turn-helix domain-containing protein [Proteus vulgaris]QPN89620.1 helix-turn-helix transcriptional regulator [Proteus vulgaris]WIF73323.1 helix-turn-helix transcriptional regulator [Proteus vulgaris]CRL64491.1 HTH-type transcriptional repressor of iron proteins A [Proteus vulgaris]